MAWRNAHTVLGICEGCGAPATHRDHDHASGRIRGLLCSPCNLAVGHLRDNPDTAAKLSEYLRRPVTGPMYADAYRAMQRQSAERNKPRRRTLRNQILRDARRTAIYGELNW